MSDESVLLKLFMESNDKLGNELKDLNSNVSQLNVNVVELKAAVEHQGNNHDDLKAHVEKLESTLINTNKRVKVLEQFKMLYDERHNVNEKRSKWWSDNWYKMFQLAIWAGGAIGVVVTLYLNLKG